MHITSLEQLRSLYAAPGERALRKQMLSLDVHARRFIALSPFVVLSTAGRDGRLDASPRGGPPGFVQVLDNGDLLLPDSPGNNRLDSLQNIVETGQLGLLFMLPGVDETLRVNGRALLSCAPDDIARCADERRSPRLVIRVAVQEAYLHCAKAFMRSRLWDPASHVERSVLPSMGQMIKEQAGLEAPVETQEEMLQRYAKDL